MARIVSIPPASNVEMDALIAAQVGDIFAISDSIGITGRVLWRLMGAAFEPHRNLATMNAVAASSVAMTAVAASSTAMTAVIASSTAMNAVAASSVAMNAVAASATAMNAVAASATAMNAVVASLTARSSVRQSITAINAINAVQSALDIMYAAAIKWTNTFNGNWQTGTLVGAGNYLIVRLTQRSLNGGSAGSTNGSYVRRGDLTGWTTTNAGSSLNLIQGNIGVILDNALQTVNGQSIQFHLLESVEIAYLTA